MIRRFLNSFLVNGVWFAAIMLNLLSAAITSIVFSIIAVAVKWIRIKL